MNGIAFYFWVCFLALHSLYEAWSWSFLCSGKEASRDRHVGSGGLSVCVSVSTQLRKKFGRHCMRSILHRLFTLVGALAQYMFTHSHGQNTVRNRARLLAWASTLQSFAVRRWLAMTYSMGIIGNESDQKISPPKLSRPNHIPACKSVLILQLGVVNKCSSDTSQG